MLVLATGVFHLQFFALGLPLAAFLLVLFVFGITLGIFGSAIVLRFGPASEWLLWPLPALLSPFAAVFYPLAMLPPWMQAVAHALPPAYVFEGMRTLLMAGRFRAPCCCKEPRWRCWNCCSRRYFYGRVYRHAVRTGLLARYSAEGAA